MAQRFSSRMRAIGDVLTANVSKTIREAAQAGTNEVVLRTPVLTGRARVNWRVTFGTPSTNKIEPPDTNDRETNRQIASAKALINASNKIKTWKVGKGNIFIANPIFYIVDLDRGSSRQAPSGMTIFGLAAIRDRLRKGRLLRGR